MESAQRVEPLVASQPAYEAFFFAISQFKQASNITFSFRESVKLLSSLILTHVTLQCMKYLIWDVSLLVGS